MRIYLDVPINEYKEALNLGAKLDKYIMKMFVYKIDLNKFIKKAKWKASKGKKCNVESCNNKIEDGSHPCYIICNNCYKVVCYHNLDINYEPFGPYKKKNIYISKSKSILDNIYSMTK
jgi:hypothetical protein